MENTRYKFRAWYEKGGYMMPVEEIDFNQGLINKSGIWRWFHEVELMQYTGLKDKNGVEIFEGDIIKTHFYSNPYVDEYGGFHEPIDSVVTAVVKNEGFCIPVLLADYQSVEVIGNIYENPDLLEVEE